MKTIKAQTYIPLAKTSYIIVYRYIGGKDYLSNGPLNNEKDVLDFIEQIKSEQAYEEPFIIEFELPI